MTKDVVALLRPFENVTVISSVLLASVIPLVLGLRNESKTPVTELAKNLKQSLSAVIEKRLAVI